MKLKGQNCLKIIVSYNLKKTAYFLRFFFTDFCYSNTAKIANTFLYRGTTKNH